MGQQPVLANVDHGILTLTLNRPETLNALNREAFEILNRELRCARFDKHVRVVVIEGNGGNFCSGADMSLLRELVGVVLEGDNDTSDNDLLDVARNIVQMEKVVVAKVDGHAIGAGFSLALLADFAIAAETAIFQMPYTRLGMLPDMGALYSVPRLVGMVRARAVALLGDRVSGGEAAKIGLIHSAVPDAQLDEAVDALVGRLLHLSPEAVGATKVGLMSSFLRNIDETIDWELTQVPKLMASEHVQKQLRAFLEKKG